jgi:tetratricopeptide (TPR) repeat protein
LRVSNYLYESDRATELKLAYDAAKAAIALAPYFAPAQVTMGQVEIYSDQAARGIARCERALELDRNWTLGHVGIGIGKIFTGQSDQTESHIREAMRLSPRDPDAPLLMAVVGHSKVHSQRFEDAVDWLTRSFELSQSYPLPHFYHAVALAYLGRIDEGREAVRVGLSLDPIFTIARFRAGASSSNSTYLAQREMIYEGMRKAGLPEE